MAERRKRISSLTTEMFWPRMEMTEEKELTTREIDRAVDGREWLSGRETGDIRVNYEQPQDLLVSR